MVGPKVVIKRGIIDEAEKPFWISFADLMTALMVLFLVVMGVALLAVTKSVTEREKKEQTHRQNIDKILVRLEEAAARHEGIKVDRSRSVIDFGDRARFALSKFSLTTDQEEILRKFVPEILALAEDSLGRGVLKRVVIEGYTDKTGTYLSNLNLSLQRSQRVLCAMFATTGPSLLSEDQKESVRRLFLVGGYSFNASKDTDEESRRVEMRLEFFGSDEAHPTSISQAANFGECALQ